MALTYGIRDLIQLFNFKGKLLFTQYGLATLFLAGILIVLLNIIESYLEIKIQREKVNRLYSESVHDPLTGVYNGKVIETLSQDYKGGVAALMFDLDHFNNVNEILGNREGDQILVRLAQVLQNNIRKEDYIIRTGSDEFLIIMPSCTLNGANKLGRKIKEILKLTEGYSEKDYPEISVTWGAAVGQSPKQNLFEVIDTADQVMYNNKR